MGRWDKEEYRRAGQMPTEKERDDALKALRNVKTRHQLARLLGVTFEKHLVYYLYRLPVDRQYFTFTIKKRTGGIRTISTPATGLKTVQRRLSKLLYAMYESRKGVHGFAVGRGIATNAEAHVRQTHVLNIDLEDFFGSINFGRVRGLFLAQPFKLPNSIATLIAQICCHENKLPQGAPTSPVISNMICGRMDSQLKQFANQNGCFYTRYADDITFSTRQWVFPSELATLRETDEERTVEVSSGLAEIIEANNGFKINKSKTRLLSRSDRQEVTGLTVNRFVNVNRRYIRNVRGAINAWRKYGLDRAQEKFTAVYSGQRAAQLDRALFGRIQFVGSIRGWDDPLYINLRNQFNDLNPSKKIPVKTIDWERAAELATWVIEDLETEIQGTAFFLEGYGIVTCAHCVGSKPFIYHPSAPAKKFPLSLVARHDVIDLAVLDIQAGTPIHAELLPQTFQSTLQRGEAVKLLGYPGHAPGKELSVKEGKIQSFTTKSTIRRFNISAPIIGGNSGGPVINRYRRVAGVAVTGADCIENAERTEEHGVIPIGALAFLGRTS
jgi:RNA-directed DNA polymerase